MKLVVNRCDGGFGLSPAAWEMLAKLKKQKIYFYMPDYASHDYRQYKQVKPEEIEGNPFVVVTKNLGKVCVSKDIRHADTWMNLLDRADKDLVKVVQMLGNEANGPSAALEVIEIPDGVQYTIEDYTGYETVHEVHRSW